MTEHLSKREGDPRTTHEYGQPYSPGSYNRGCRCEWCKKAKANQYQLKKGNDALYEIPPAPGERPKRPPGVVWLDPSGVTTVVRCERCNKNYGPWLQDEAGAARFRDAHSNIHVEDPPFDWEAYDKERIFKQSGGRPPQEGLCSDEACSGKPFSKGLCQRHYMRAYRKAVCA